MGKREMGLVGAFAPHQPGHRLIHQRQTRPIVAAIH